MLTRLMLKNLTVFSDVDFEFAPGLNVIVGENGAGKSHVLKAAYTVAAVSARGEKDSGSPTPTKNYLALAIAKKMRGVFRPDELGRLARRQAGRSRCEIEAWFQTESETATDGVLVQHIQQDRSLDRSTSHHVGRRTLRSSCRPGSF